MNDNPMPSGRVVLRASAKYWLTERIGPLLLLWSFAIVALALDGSRSLRLVVLCVLGSLFLMWPVITTARVRLEVDVYGLRGRIHGQPFDLSWTDVRALRCIEIDRKKPLLQIGGSTGGVEFMLDELNSVAAWQALQRFAPAAALAENAFDSLSWFQEQRTATTAWLADVTSTMVHVRISRWPAAFGWITVIFWVALSLFAGISSSDSTWTFFLAFALPGLCLVYLGSPVTEIGPERVSLTMPLWPTYAMSWAEVQRVALDHSDDQFVLYGPGKRLTLPGPRWWRRADREVGLGAIFGHLEQRGIPFERTARAGFALPRGTRVPRKAGK